jgi:hypothetical protein
VITCGYKNVSMTKKQKIRKSKQILVNKKGIFKSKEIFTPISSYQAGSFFFCIHEIVFMKRIFLVVYYNVFLSILVGWFKCDSSDKIKCIYFICTSIALTMLLLSSLRRYLINASINSSPISTNSV